uniref:Uncharacterized protein n=1 Tax=Aureoumbra lagunensis TaxID=44058 RepID=A0A7S3NJW7_9STRA|mmetsp:Transcript_8234/g.11467  ORF Transcript_8234/g.11467 Transcript_8234/m.11467 type:complete len:336 (-) Transcript_8234:50-1057(-)
MAEGERRIGHRRILLISVVLIAALVLLLRTEHDKGISSYQTEFQAHTNGWFYREGNSCLAQKAERCLHPPHQGSWGMSSAECAQWIINTTDLVWRPSQSERQVVDAIERYYFVDFESRSGGTVTRGMEARKAQVLALRRAFSNLQIRIDDVFCFGNDIDGYKASVTEVHLGTNDGPSIYGKATHHSVAYSGIVNMFIHKDPTDSNRLKYKTQNMLHDDLSLLIQLGHSLPSSSTIVEAPSRCTVFGPMNWCSSSSSSSTTTSGDSSWRPTSSHSGNISTKNSSDIHFYDDDYGIYFGTTDHKTINKDDDDNEEKHAPPVSSSSARSSDSSSDSGY